MSDLEQRISAALGASDIASDDISQLLIETDAGITTADETAEAERATALDPALSPDPKAARQAMEDAIFCRDRLKTLLPRLQKRHKEVQAKEYAERWYKEFDAVQAECDALAKELQAYPAMVAKLVDVLSRIPAIDAEVSRINRSAPPGVHNRLQPVEEKARNVKGFGVSGAWDPHGLLSLVADLKLPKFEADGNRYQYSWPPPQPTLAQMYVPPASFFIPVDPQAEADERQRKAREDNDKMMEFYQKQREQV